MVFSAFHQVNLWNECFIFSPPSASFLHIIYFLLVCSVRLPNVGMKWYSQHFILHIQERHACFRISSWSDFDSTWGVSQDMSPRNIYIFSFIQCGIFTGINGLNLIKLQKETSNSEIKWFSFVIPYLNFNNIQNTVLFRLCKQWVLIS